MKSTHYFYVALAVIIAGATAYLATLGNNAPVWGAAALAALVSIRSLFVQAPTTDTTTPVVVAVKASPDDTANNTAVKS